MPNAERQPGYFRKVEADVEKAGGLVLAVFGIFTHELQPVAMGLLIHLIGKWRTPKTA